MAKKYFLVTLAPLVTLATTKGTIVVELAPTEAPVTVANFLAYVNSGYFNGTIFHRVIKGFMNQGGGFTRTNADKTSLIEQTGATLPPIALESNNGLRNTKGTIAMARTSAPNSATTEFFINAVNNAFLDYKPADLTATPPVNEVLGYAVFGRVIEGLDVVDAINQVEILGDIVDDRFVPKSLGGYEDVPKEDIIITSATQTR